MTNVNYSKSSIRAHLLDGTASIVGTPGAYELHINGAKVQDVADILRDKVLVDLTAQKDALVAASAQPAIDQRAADVAAYEAAIASVA